MLSNYCINNRKKYGIKTGGLNKLIPDLGSKKRYVVHYKNRLLHLSLGIN